MKLDEDPGYHNCGVNDLKEPAIWLVTVTQAPDTSLGYSITVTHPNNPSAFRQSLSCFVVRWTYKMTSG